MRPLRSSYALDQEEMIRENMVFGVPSNKGKRDPPMAALMTWNVNEDHYKFHKLGKQQLSTMGEYGRFKAKIDHSSNHFTSEYKDQFCSEEPAKSFRKSHGPDCNLQETKATHKQSEMVSNGRTDDQNIGRTVKFDPKVKRPQSAKQNQLNTDISCQTEALEESTCRCCCQYSVQKRVCDAAQQTRCECHKATQTQAQCQAEQLPINQNCCQIRVGSKNQPKIDASMTFGKEAESLIESVQKNNPQSKVITSCSKHLVQEKQQVQIVAPPPIVHQNEAQKQQILKKRPDSCKKLTSNKKLQNNQKNQLKTSKIGVEENALMPGLGDRIKQLHGLTRFLPDSTVQQYTKKPAFQNYGRANVPLPDPTRPKSALKTHNTNPERAYSRDHYFDINDPKPHLKSNTMRMTSSKHHQQSTQNVQLTTSVFDKNHQYEINNRHRDGSHSAHKGAQLYSYPEQLGNPLQKSVHEKRYIASEQQLKKPNLRTDVVEQYCPKHKAKLLDAPNQRFVQVPLEYHYIQR